MQRKSWNATKKKVTKVKAEILHIETVITEFGHKFITVTLSFDEKPKLQFDKEVEVTQIGG